MKGLHSGLVVRKKSNDRMKFVKLRYGMLWTAQKSAALRAGKSAPGTPFNGLLALPAAAG